MKMITPIPGLHICEILPRLTLTNKCRVLVSVNCGLTRDHLPKAVVHGIRRRRGNCRYCLT